MFNSKLTAPAGGAISCPLGVSRRTDDLSSRQMINRQQRLDDGTAGSRPRPAEKEQRTMCFSATRKAPVSEPTLTIGLPVYNGATSLAAALNSLLHQSYTDYTLHISDNASTDETALICKEAAARDSRIVYIRQPQHIPAFENFKFVLQNAKTPYFMWAADDDRWHSEFIAKNLALLEANSLAIASISQVAFVRDGALVLLYLTYPLRGTITENSRRYWRKPTDSSRLYAVYKTEVLKKSVENIPQVHAADWLVIASALQYGHYLEVPEVLMWRSAPEPDRYLKQVARDNRGRIARLFPLLPMTYHAITKLGLRNLPIWRMIQLNYFYHRGYVMLITRDRPILFDILQRVYRVPSWINRKSGLKNFANGSPDAS